MDADALKKQMEEIAERTAKHFSDMEKDRRHVTYDKVSAAMFGLEARQKEIEQALREYVRNCEQGTAQLKGGLDRLFLLVQGDSMSQGILSSHKEFQTALEERLKGIEHLQSESQKYRTQNETIPAKVDALAQTVQQIVKERETAEISTKAYKHSAWVGFIVISGGLSLVWNIFTWVVNTFHLFGVAS